MSLHLEANVGDIAETVLLPGDPLRAKYVADNFLKDVVCYNRVRNMFGFTGTYNDRRVSIQGSGMGMGSTAIYVNELITDYHVKNVIRVGTCGAIRDDLQLGQVILAMSASGDSSANMTNFNGMHYAATADFDLLLRAWQIAERLGVKTHTGSIFSTNTFYADHEDRWKIWAEHGILGVEMETQILFTLAKKLGAKALSVLTVSDNIVTGAAATSEDREQSYMDMMKIALELA